MLIFLNKIVQSKLPMELRRQTMTVHSSTCLGRATAKCVRVRSVRSLLNKCEEMFEPERIGK